MSEITLKQINDSMLSHFDSIYGKLGDLKQEQTLMNGALRRVEGDVAELKTGLKRVEDKVDRIETTLDAHVRLPAHV